MRPFSPDESERSAGAEPAPARLSDTLDRLVRHLGWAEGRESVGVLARWEELVGPVIAAHVRPVALEGSALVVAVEDPAWASQLRWLEGRLLEQVNTSAGTRLDRLDVRHRPSR